MNTHISFPSRKAQLGLTIIELMVALLLGILLTGGAIQLFVSNRATYGFNEGFARLQENGRFALDTLSYHARLAGYLGCLSNVPRYNRLGSATALDYDFEDGLAGVEATGTTPGQTFAAAALDPPNSTNAADWSGTGLPAGLLGSVIKGSDVLIVRHGSTQSHTLLSPFTTATAVTADAGAADYDVGDVAIVSDCQKATIFQITSVGAIAGGITIGHTATGTPGNALASWTTDEQYGAGAQLLKGETWVFYVGARTGGPPALFQQRLQTGSGTSSALVAEELVEGVETMQVRYGIDAAQDGTIDSYVTANNVANWEQVATVRVSLLVRSPEEYGTEVDDDTYSVDEVIFNPVDDRRIRQVFTATIAIRNRLP